MGHHRHDASESPQVDRYTLSIKMKAIKRVNYPKDVVLALELLNQANIYVCSVGKIAQ